MTKVSSDGVKSHAEKKPSCVRKWANERVRGDLVEKVNHPGPSECARQREQQKQIPQGRATVSEFEDRNRALEPG